MEDGKFRLIFERATAQNVQFLPKKSVAVLVGVNSHRKTGLSRVTEFMNGPLTRPK